MIRVGQVGIGQWGKNHSRIFQQMMSRDEGILFMGAFDVKHIPFDEVFMYDKLEDLIGEISALVITTPTSTHYEIAKQALENGVHVFIEKPVCSEVWQAEELAELAQGLIVQVGHIERFNPAYQRLKKETSLMMFPVCTRFGNPGRSLDDSIVMDLMIHDIDLILDLAQSSIENIAGLRSFMGAIASSMITFENGMIVFLQASHLLPKERKMDIIDKIGNMYKLDFQERTLYENGKLLQKKTNDNLLELELKAFIESVGENKPPLVGIDDAIKSLKVAKEIEKLIDLPKVQQN